MKKIALILVLIISINIFGCSNDKRTDEEILNDILYEIEGECTSIIIKLQTELDNTCDSVGDSYNNYLSNKNMLTDWYALALTETEAMYDKIDIKMDKYYDYVATMKDEEITVQYKAIEKIYEVVFEKSLEEYKQLICNDSYEGIKKTYGDIIHEAYESTERKEWMKESSEFNITVLREKAHMYNLFQEKGTYLFEKWQASGEKLPEFVKE